MNLEEEYILLELISRLMSTFDILSLIILICSFPPWSRHSINYNKFSLYEFMRSIPATRELRGFLSSWETAPFINVANCCSAFASLYNILSDISIIWIRVLFLLFSEILNSLIFKCTKLKWTFSSRVFLTSILNTLSFKFLKEPAIISSNDNLSLNNSYSELELFSPRTLRNFSSISF